MAERIHGRVVFLTLWLAFVAPGPSGAGEIEVDRGELVPSGMASRAALDAPSHGSSHLTGFDIAIDQTHNTGRQGLALTSYQTVQGDLAGHGAAFTPNNTSPLSLSLLQQFDAWWLEEDFIATYLTSEIDALEEYVEGGGCLFLNGDENDPDLLARFDVPYAGAFGVSGTTADITPSFLTDAFPPSAFPGPVAQVLVPFPVNSLAPVPTAIDVVRDLGANPMVALNEIGNGGVVVFGDEMTIDGSVNSADNRTLGNRVFEFCAFGLNTPPVASCIESVNPSGKNVPPAGSTTPPGSKGGQNEDGFYELVGEDEEDGTAPLFVTNASGSATFGPYVSGSVVKITEAPGATPTAKGIGGPTSSVAAHITLDTDAFVFAVDSADEESEVVSCLVPPLPK